MTRRVIFPPADIWTQKENTMNNNADYRRATALIRHHGIGDQEGITAILEEAEAHDRGTQLFVALLGIYSFVESVLRTEASQVAVRQCIDLTTDADDQPYWVRAAASAIAAHADDDKDRLCDVIDEVLAEGRGAGVLFQGVSDIWYHLMPELRAPAGLHALTRWTEGLAGAEGEEGHS